MLFSEILNEAADSSKLFYGLVAAAVAHGSPQIKPEFGPTHHPEFDRVSRSDFKIRFAVSGKAAEFIKTPEAKAIIEEAGWIITVLKDTTVTRNFVDQHVVEVRLENADTGEPSYYPPAVLYHVTPTRHVADILQHGLQPRLPSRPEMHRYPPRIHFTTTLPAAEKIIRLFNTYDVNHGITQSYTVLQIDTKAVQPLYVDPEFHRDGVYTVNPVSASAIHQIDSI